MRLLENCIYYNVSYRTKFSELNTPYVIEPTFIYVIDAIQTDTNAIITIIYGYHTCKYYRS